jgi:hypothetical protein
VHAPSVHTGGLVYSLVRAVDRRGHPHGGISEGSPRGRRAGNLGSGAGWFANVRAPTEHTEIHYTDGQVPLLGSRRWRPRPAVARRRGTPPASASSRISASASASRGSRGCRRAAAPPRRGPRPRCVRSPHRRVAAVLVDFIYRASDSGPTRRTSPGRHPDSQEGSGIGGLRSRGGQQGRTPPLDRSTVPESVIDRIGSVDNPMSQRRISGTLASRRRSAPMAIIEQKRPARTAAAKTMRGRGRRGFREATRRQAGCRAGRSSGRDRRPDRDLGALPHRHPRRPRRLAGQAVAAVHPLPNDPRGTP